MSVKSEDVLTAIEQNKATYLEELKDFLRIPSVSAVPERKADVLRCSEFVLSQMRQAGA